MASGADSGANFRFQISDFKKRVLKAVFR